MVALDVSSENKSSNRLVQLLNRVRYRSIETDEDREAVFRLRYEAYRREGIIDANIRGLFADDYDEKGNVRLFGVYIDEQLAGSVRIHIADRSSSTCPSLEPFRDILEPEINKNKTIVDSTRFVTDKRLSQEWKGLAYITLRVCWMAIEHFEADHFLAAVRAEHQAFYRRTFRHRLICPPRTYPLLGAPICLMSTSYEESVDSVVRRYPIFRSDAFERRMLFGGTGPVKRFLHVAPEVA